MANTNAPWTTVRTRADQADVAAQVDQTVLNSQCLTDSRSPVGRIFFTNTAKIELHIGTLEFQAGRIPDDFIEPNSR